MFRRRTKTVQVLRVVDRDHPGNIGTVEVVRGRTLRRYDRLEVISASSGPGPIELKVFVNGRSGAATVRVREGDFDTHSVLRIDDVSTEPADD